MAPRTIYANLADGLQPFTLWDASLADMGSLGVIPCTATGTNAIVLIPVGTANAPNITIPRALQVFSFVAVGNSSGAVTIQVGTTAALKLYRIDGVTQATTGDLVSTVTYLICYNPALNAAAGGFQFLSPFNAIGAYIESVVPVGSPVSLVSNTAKTITSISLTAGDWDVDASLYFLSAGTTNVTRYIASISSTTDTLDTSAGKLSDNSFPAFVPGTVGQSGIIAPYRINLATTTTIFIVGFATFTVSTMTAYGIIRARLVR